MLIAANMTLGELGPVVVKLECKDEVYRSIAREFDKDEDAIAYWEGLQTTGDLIYDEGRVFIGEVVIGLALDMDLDPEGMGRLTLMFDHDPEAQITIVETTTFIRDVALGFLGNTPRVHRRGT
jgi:hypothetical protein